ncbi:hypothetical protein ACG0Z4_21835 [Enterocloster aldenensis]|uniref:AfsR/SARP family transcriptional regulator n=1 Tax=Enterocloster aldenensis TaxID=358742 RepID=UPI004028FBF4
MSADSHIFIQTFSGFDLFVDNQVVYFSSKKSKELLALLVSKRGGSVPLSEIAYILYSNTPERTAKNNIRVIGYRLRQILREYGCEGLLVHRPGVYSVNIELFICDYYEFMKENRTYITAYTGKYMPEYLWASEVVPYLNAIYNLYNKKYPLLENESDSC